jgi:hypothetical protein
MMCEYHEDEDLGALSCIFFNITLLSPQQKNTRTLSKASTEHMLNCDLSESLAQSCVMT